MRGQFAEQMAPYFPDFPAKPSELIFVGKPIDFIAFEGMDEGSVGAISFIEVKTGNARLSKRQQQIKDVVEKGRVRFKQYRAKV